MKSVKYEGFYHCMHNHSIRICSLIQGEKLRIFSLKSQMDEEMARRRGRQPILYKIAVKVDNKFKYASGETS
jgi:hypothetical protein